MKATYSMIAACGMNCSLCMAFQRTKNKCMGCKGPVEASVQHCRVCIIANCSDLSDGYCGSCNQFPCKRLKSLDKRYRGKYHMSMIENLQAIKRVGLETFEQTEAEKWKCPNCGSLVCVHREKCLVCGFGVFRNSTE
jgi:hypothetical protein